MFDYCSIVWGNCGKTLSERLQKLQNRAARILTSSSYDADARYLLQQLGWKDLITQPQIQVALMVFKALNNLAPDYLSFMFTERSTSLRLCVKGLYQQIKWPFTKNQLPKKEL